jgi:hypothetical protein
MLQTPAADFRAIDGARPVLISNRGTTLHEDPQVLRGLAEIFARDEAVALHGVLQAGFLEMLLSICRRAPFVPQRIGLPGMRRVEAAPAIAGKALRTALFRPAFLRWLDCVTGCGSLASAQGEVSEIGPQGDERLSWHDDRHQPFRRLGITINLSESEFAGGHFEMRRDRAPQIVFRHTHAGLGDALIFRIRDGLEHRVLPVTAGGPRRVFAGSFAAVS